MTKLTATAVEKLKPTNKRIERPDTQVKGLVLIVQPTGSKSWQVRYRAFGVRRRMALGAYPAVSLADARKSANAALLKVVDGCDPVAERSSFAEAKTLERDKVGYLVEQFAKVQIESQSAGNTLCFLPLFSALCKHFKLITHTSMMVCTQTRRPALLRNPVSPC